MTEQDGQTNVLGKNILIFADGTGNEGGLLPDESRTNVYKLYRATRVDPTTSINPNEQIAFYVSGIGTPTPGSASSWQRAKNRLEQAFGNGLSQKIAECYVSIISVWRPGDRIYLFGFSRGAYTVRCLAHVLERMGIPTKESDGSDLSLDPSKLYKLARSAIRTYFRFGLTTADTKQRDAAAEAFCKLHASHIGSGTVPYFIGVWDTVAAVGWGRFIKNRYEMHLPRGIQFVRHALAIDEYRKTFARVPWGSSHTMRPAVAGEPWPFEQMWFAGNHADIGGSYPENESRLSDITLEWISKFVSEELPQFARISIDKRYLNLHSSYEGMMHDECMSGKIPYTKKVRHVAAEGALHESVYARFALEAVRNFDSYGRYRPANLEKHPKVIKYYESPIEPSR